MMGPGMIGMPMMMILMLLFMVLALTVAVFLAKWLWENIGVKKQAPSADDAVEIIRQRYAKGEITREEFEQVKRDLLEGRQR